VSSTRNITFAIAVNNREVYENNFLASPSLQGLHHHSIFVQQNFESAAKAYNDAIDRSPNDLIVFCHQDLFLPQAWLSDLERAIAHLEVKDPEWGVLGCSGVTSDNSGHGYVYSSGLGIVGKPFESPVPIQTLDEIVLILRKSSGLRFDERLPNFHFYGTDICLRAAEMGRQSYAISAFCVHNTHQSLVLPKEFYDCCRHIKTVWKGKLPIQTTCIRITRFNVPMYVRRLKEFRLRYILRREVGGRRVQNAQRLFEEACAAAAGRTAQP
jgi:hypothetical protein